MIKRLFTLIGLLCSVCVASDARDIEIRIDNAVGRDTTISEEGYRFNVKVKEIQPNGNVTMHLEIENLSGEYYSGLFTKEYDKRTIKTIKFSDKKLKFDKRFFPEAKLKVCAIKEDILIPPSGHRILKLESKAHRTITLKLPIYRIKEKERRFIFWKKTELRICEENNLTLKIVVDLPSEAYEAYRNFKAAYDRLEEKCNEATFCTNPKHKPSLEEQHKPFLDEIDILKNQIKEFRDEQNFYWGDKVSKPYENLIKLLEDLEQKLQNKESDCGEHRTFGVAHKCDYCSYTPKMIYELLDKIYIDTYNGERDGLKSQDRTVVEKAYNCPRASKKWKIDENYRKKITECYKDYLKL